MFVAFPTHVGVEIQVEAIWAAEDAGVGSLQQVIPRTAGGTLIAATANARLALGRALLTTLLIVPEKSRRTLGYAHPGVILKLEEVMQTGNALLRSRTLASVVTTFRVAGANIVLTVFFLGLRLGH